MQQISQLGLSEYLSQFYFSDTKLTMLVSEGGYQKYARCYLVATCGLVIH